MIFRLNWDGRGCHTIIFDRLLEIEAVLGENDIIISPVGYFGRRPTLRKSSELHAFAVDIDGVGLDQLLAIFHQAKNGVIPNPTYIVNSGNGVHLYYLLDAPEPMLTRRKPYLKQLRLALINKVWNFYTSSLMHKQYGSLIQGFRAPGTQSKLGGYADEYLPVTVYRYADRIRLDRLAEMLETPAPMKKPQRPKYERTGKTWHVNRALYDWWLRKIRSEITGGHRYFGMMTLAIYARKCDVDRAELERDADGLMDYLNVIYHEPFTEKDKKSALKAYDAKYHRFPRAVIERLTAVPMPPNKRNGRKRAEHIQVMNAMKAVKKQLGETVKEGRPSARQRVLDWREAHPEGTPKDCISATGLSKNTVYRWWSAPR